MRRLRRAARIVKRWAVLLSAFVLLMVGGLMGTLAAAHLPVVVWGPSILDEVLGKPPDRTHPVFWLFIGMIAPTMLLGFAGAFFGLLIPLYYFTGERLSFPQVRDRTDTLWMLTTYHRWIVALLYRETVGESPSEMTGTLPPDTESTQS